MQITMFFVVTILFRPIMVQPWHGVTGSGSSSALLSSLLLLLAVASSSLASPMMTSSLGKRLTSNSVAAVGKRPRELYSFGIGKNSLS